MKNITKITVYVCVLTAALLMTESCQSYDVDEVLLSRDEISLTVKGRLQCVYDPLTCQLGYNEDNCEFRVYDDRLGDWFVLNFNVLPVAEGMRVKADVEYTTSDSRVSDKGLEFVVKKMDLSGYVWLWNASDEIGVVIKMP